MGEVVLDGELLTVKAGDVVQIPTGTKHSIRAITNIELIEVQTGSELIEEDVIRLYMSWREIESVCL
jgi:mannose-1-phosphate guanylyltransferase